MTGQPLASALPASGDLLSPSERLGALFDAHHGRLYRLARRLSSSADQAQDLVQDTFLKAAGAVGSVPQGASREEAWLVRVLINLQRDRWRRDTVRRRALSVMHFNRGAENATQEAAVVAKRLVRQALERLPPRRRAVVVLHELEEMAPAEIAALLGIRAVTVRWHLSRGRQELAHVLKRLGGMP